MDGPSSLGQKGPQKPYVVGKNLSRWVHPHRAPLRHLGADLFERPPGLQRGHRRDRGRTPRGSGLPPLLGVHPGNGFLLQACRRLRRGVRDLGEGDLQGRNEPAGLRRRDRVGRPHAVGLRRVDLRRDRLRPRVGRTPRTDVGTRDPASSYPVHPSILPFNKKTPPIGSFCFTQVIFHQNLFSNLHSS